MGGGHNAATISHPSDLPDKWQTMKVGCNFCSATASYGQPKPLIQWPNAQDSCPLWGPRPLRNLVLGTFVALLMHSSIQRLVATRQRSYWPISYYATVFSYPFCNAEVNVTWQLWQWCISMIVPCTRIMQMREDCPSRLFTCLTSRVSNVYRGGAEMGDTPVACGWWYIGSCHFGLVASRERPCTGVCCMEIWTRN